MSSDNGSYLEEPHTGDELARVKRDCERALHRVAELERALENARGAAGVLHYLSDKCYHGEHDRCKDGPKFCSVCHGGCICWCHRKEEGKVPVAAMKSQETGETEAVA